MDGFRVDLDALLDAAEQLRAVAAGLQQDRDTLRTLIQELDGQTNAAELERMRAVLEVQAARAWALQHDAEEICRIYQQTEERNIRRVAALPVPREDPPTGGGVNGATVRETAPPLLFHAAQSELLCNQTILHEGWLLKLAAADRGKR